MVQKTNEETLADPQRLAADGYPEGAPKISVIVPVYRVEEYLDACVTSLVHQTYQNLEILLIDDGSPDRCPALCDAWAKKDPRIRVFHTENRGVSHARNVGLDQATGDYIGFVDSDDWVDLDYYENMAAALRENGADVCGAGYTREDPDGPHIILRKGEAKVYTRDEILREIFGQNVPKLLWWELCDKLFCRELVTKVRLDEHITHAEDMLFFWQIMKGARRFAYQPTYGYHYRMREGSAIHGGLTETSMTSYAAIGKIFADAKQEGAPLQHILWGQYASSTIGAARDWLLLGADAHRAEIEKAQRFLRKNFWRVQRLPYLSLRMRLGSIYLLLPFTLCKALRGLVRKHSD